MKKRYTLLIVFIFLSFAIQAQSYFPPAGKWQKKTASEFKIDSSKLNAAIKFAEENEYSGSRDLRQAILKGFEKEPYPSIVGPTKKRGRPTGMIIKNGYLIASWGDIKRVDMTFSVTKSFLSTTALLALDENIIGDVNDKVDKYVWDGTFEGEHNSKITWKNLLQQNSDWSGELWGGKDWADRPPSEGGIDDWKYRKLHEPGTYFKYNDVRVNVLAYSLLQVWRQPLPKILKEKVMDPIGASTTWRWYGYDNAWVNIDGLKMQSVSGGGHSGGGMFISTEDMARFGLLFENNGNWDGNQIISKKLVDEAMMPSTANSNYGYMWWLNQPGKYHWDGISNELFYAAGFGGNFIIVDQKNEVVIVVRWLEPSKVNEFITKVIQAY